MKIPGLFIPEKNLDKKTEEYRNKVEYIQKPYDEEELGIGATVYLMPEMISGILKKDAEKVWKSVEQYTVVINPKEIGTYEAETTKYACLSIEELEKKLLEGYTTSQ